MDLVVKLARITRNKELQKNGIEKRLPASKAQSPTPKT
jgi:hypothetical protein